MKAKTSHDYFAEVEIATNSGLLQSKTIIIDHAVSSAVVGEDTLPANAIGKLALFLCFIVGIRISLKGPDVFLFRNS